MADALPQENKFVEVDAEEYKKEIAQSVREEVTKEFDTKLEESKKVIQEEATTQATQRAKEALAESLVGKPKPEPKYSWEKEGRQPKDYSEIAEETKRLAKEEMTAEQQKAEEERVAKETETKKEAEENTKKAWEVANSRWDAQLDTLESEGKIPTIGEETKKKYEETKKLTGDERIRAVTDLRAEDAGLDARIKVQEIALENAVKGRDVDMELAYYKYYRKQPAGADAPVFGSNKSVSSDSGEDFAYEDIAGKKPSDVYRETNH